MFGLSEPHYNIVKKRTKECMEEVKDLVAGGKKYDEVAAKVIDKHYDSVKVLLTRLQFVWLCGYLHGTLAKKDADYE